MPDPIRSLKIGKAEIHIFDDAGTACKVAADRIVAAIKQSVEERDRAILGLATGSTPIPVYKRLVQLHRKGDVSFADVTTYNLDEYYPISPLNPQSYRYYMNRHLFSKVNLPPHQTHLPDGTTPEPALEQVGVLYDRWIKGDGGLDLQLLGIGRNGHVAFNEPIDLPVEEAIKLPTRAVQLHPTTIEDAADDFGGIEHVPTRAITVGTKTILAAKSLLILAFGTKKADAVQKSLLEPMTSKVPASLLQRGGNRVTWLLDIDAAAGLTEE